MTNVVEEAAHVNLWWATGWCNSSGTWFLDMAQELAAARAAGIRNVVLSLWPNMVWGDGAAAEAAFQFKRLGETGQLAGFDTVVIYPQDEPDRMGKSDEEMTAAVAMLRAAAAPVPALARAKVGVIYACATGATPGIAAFDWIGCDDYDRGCAVLRDWYAREIGAGQRLVLVPGGATGPGGKWRQDPACFLSFAEGDPRVVAITPFIWQTVTDRGTTYPGIRDNGMRPLYCQAGSTVVSPGKQAGCGS